MSGGAGLVVNIVVGACVLSHPIASRPSRLYHVVDTNGKFFYSKWFSLGSGLSFVG